MNFRTLAALVVLLTCFVTRASADTETFDYCRTKACQETVAEGHCGPNEKTVVKETVLKNSGTSFKTEITCVVARTVAPSIIIKPAFTVDTVSVRDGIDFKQEGRVNLVCAKAQTAVRVTTSAGIDMYLCLDDPTRTKIDAATLQIAMPGGDWPLRWLDRLCVARGQAEIVTCNENGNQKDICFSSGAYRSHYSAPVEQVECPKYSYTPRSKSFVKKNPGSKKSKSSYAKRATRR